MTWKRLEGSAVDPQLSEGISSPLADPLWMLARQWQVGEFRGEDAASPVLMTGTVLASPIAEYRVGDGPSPDIVPRDRTGVPLETLTESEPISTGPAELRMRLESGAALVRRLRAARLPADLVQGLGDGYPLATPVGDSDDEALDPVGTARLRLLARRSPDAWALADAVAAAGGDPANLPELAGRPDRTVTRAARIITSWLEQEADLFRQPSPEQPSAWSARRQEYRMGVAAESTAGTIALDAPEYPGGRLDWFHFDVESRPEVDGPGDSPPGLIRKRLTSLPVPLEIAGMPAARWWEFEDGDVSFGDLARGPEDLARSVVAAYAMVAGEDWYLLPCTLPVGSVAVITDLRVRDNFGMTTRIEATAVNDGDTDRPWRWFELSGDPGPERGDAPLLFLPPVVTSTEAGPPLESVEFRRDEQANLGWAIERRVESIAGRPVDREKGNPPDPWGRDVSDDGTWAYQLATDVWDNWVPLVPVRITAARPEIVMRRGTIAGADGDAHSAKGRILEPDGVFVVHEEEVPSGGVRVSRRWQLARSADGDVHLWVGRRKRPAGGPMRRTPLRYDSVRPSSPPEDLQ